MIKFLNNPQWETMGGVCNGPVAAAVASAVVSAVASKVLAPKPKTGQLDAEMAAAQRRQKENLDAQQAVVNRQRVEADKREEELSGQLAGQRRAALARRQGRGQLAYNGGGSTGLKTTLGG